MIVKLNNKTKNFYNTMGRFFGSRIVQNKTNDRIYDDNKKDWYVNFEKNNPVAFVSVSANVIKNVYSINDDYLLELLKYILNDIITIKESIVTKTYLDVYKRCGLLVNENISFKNFVKIRSDDSEQ